MWSLAIQKTMAVIHQAPTRSKEPHAYYVFDGATRYQHDFREFKRHIDNIAWDTEVWIENNPDHMIHFNEPQFFTVYGA